ncbi:putative phosphothreonine lyase domain-containg protein [Kitasatospora sp. NPDC056184]|uniref:putative phosphothreonine lyase domain-containing protein n=1 Tax=Kitasatospora sp. NPDC056184 TaxID=3345738 RepID=UPI0035DAB534
MGKWLWFVPLSQIDDAWAGIRAAVESNRLSFAAKAGTLANHRGSTDDTRRPICIYTPDWRDIPEVERVLTRLRAMGIKDTLRYKRDTDTVNGRYGPGAASYICPAGTTALVVSHRTRQALDHYQQARAQARRAAEKRRALKPQ